jgi:hypothetical protein
MKEDKNIGIMTTLKKNLPQKGVRGEGRAVLKNGCKKPIRY